MTIKLVIARHGNTFAPGDIVRRVGVTDLPLVESGVAQGTKLGQYLKKHDLIPDKIYTSFYKRTQETAMAAQKAMHTRLPLTKVRFLNEVNYGIDENKPEEEVIARIGKEALAAWEDDAIVPDGWDVDPADIINDWHAFSVVLRSDYHGKKLLCVTSNGIIRFAPVLTGKFKEFKENHTIKIPTGNLCIFEFHKGVTWECVAWNVKPE